MNLLEIVYTELDFQGGDLMSTGDDPLAYTLEEWLEKGEWLTAARKAGAEKIFFIDNNPVAVFAKCALDERAQVGLFNKLWCLSRPRILFLEMEGELSVIDLAQAPVRLDAEKEQQELKILLTATRNVAQELQAFHRDQIESGKLFESGRFGTIKNRADQSLIADLKIVRQELMTTGLKNSHAHALIGRSIFIRYLEDRGILNESYFSRVAELSPQWQTLLHEPLAQENFNLSGVSAIYPRVLQSKSFTYALFRALSADFNGDMFPNIDEEENNVDTEHLQLIQDLLYGDVGVQKKLFFFNYKFDIIPLDLISAIYEEFYHSSSEEKDNKKGKINKRSKARQDGAYYTPPVLAEFVLSRLLTVDVLKQKPRILDPACGSGIFLVEAFRRIVRYEISQDPSVLSFNTLKHILGRQIIGIEVNEEAARITAFSLYLAMLHYLSPPSILDHVAAGNRLPNLIVSDQKTPNHFDNLHIGNAFAIDNIVVGNVDIVVGNPPWGAPDSKADNETKERQRIMLRWCEDKSLTIGDKESSQAFIWRATDFLKLTGKCALLTSAGVLFKHSKTTQAFRREWMSQICITEVFNFTHVRSFFFQAISPFVMIHFTKKKQNETPVEYWSAKQVASLKETQSVLLSKYDRSYLVNQDLTDNKTWKINWFGKNNDNIFINSLRGLFRLRDFVSSDSGAMGRGYQTYEARHETKKYEDIPENTLDDISNRYNPLYFSNTPELIYNAGPIKAYLGKKIIIKEGISQKDKDKGKIIARYESTDFSFYRTLYGFKLKDDDDNTYAAITGVLWSSFSRYYFFNTTANWGLWNDKILLDELMQLPIPKTIAGRNADRIISIVQSLRKYNPTVLDVLNPVGLSESEIEAQRHKWEFELDEAVFDLYGFTEDQRDLIRDCCEITLPFFYKPYTCVGSLPVFDKNDISWLQRYANCFSQRWQPYLSDDEVMRADLHIGASHNMLAMEFYPADVDDPWNLSPKIDSWSYILEEIGNALPCPMGTSQILLEGIVHIVTDHSIIVIKRNEKRFWTRSLAREDAESTLAKRMIETMPQPKGVK